GARQPQRASALAGNPDGHLFRPAASSPPLARHAFEPEGNLGPAEILRPGRTPVLAVEGGERVDDAVAAQNGKEEGSGRIGARRRPVACRAGRDRQQQREKRCRHRSDSYLRSSTSRTFFNRSSREKGLARKSAVNSDAAPPEYPETQRSFSVCRRARSCSASSAPPMNGIRMSV